ncbi:replication protein A 70 kDa DNA-binding subunit [Trifolium pratense]|uniref:Replication protein A 70 kDa DNA-binding subunit n=1 Tax=Trifolium pratense TaxID=57577 RepID=A0A2K3NKZ4_TRIPR|nr:replication protein A 70 kDa DNA-binding subunit [Trifolium pratense]
MRACLRNDLGSFLVAFSCHDSGDDVHKDKPNHPEYSSLIVNCRTSLSSYPDFVVAFARRQAKGSAHAIARTTLSHASRITFDVIPHCIATIILNEMP